MIGQALGGIFNSLFGSNRDSAVEKWNKDVDTLYGDTRNMNVNIGNRFNADQRPFNYANKMGKLDETMKQQFGNIDRYANTQGLQGIGNNTSAMASQGITGGAALNQANRGIMNDVNRNAYNTKQDLMANRLGMNANLMGVENQDEFNRLNAASQIDLSNVGNQLNRQGILSNLMGQKGQAAVNQKDTTWLDDIMGIGNMASNFGVRMPWLGGGGRAAGVK